jgi:hypothetical protein
MGLPKLLGSIIARLGTDKPDKLRPRPLFMSWTNRRRHDRTCGSVLAADVLNRGKSDTEAYFGLTII